LEEIAEEARDARGGEGTVECGRETQRGEEADLWIRLAQVAIERAPKEIDLVRRELEAFRSVRATEVKEERAFEVSRHRARVEQRACRAG
jgi:hypothetical protein